MKPLAEVPHEPVIPDSYRLLAVFSGQPQTADVALRRAGMYQPGVGPTVAQQQTLRRLRNEGLIRWVREPQASPNPAAPRFEEGFVLTGRGEAVLDTYHQKYGPALSVPTPDAHEVAE